jgi:hypothetical protein
MAVARSARSTSTQRSERSGARSRATRYQNDRGMYRAPGDRVLSPHR